MIIDRRLIEEQEIIINSTESKILVSAGPGSGKTHTLIKKAEKELRAIEEKSLNKGIIVCSFTREVSRELEKKLSNKVYNEFSYVGTIDSFILNKIVIPFKNRILSKLLPKSPNIQGKLNVTIPPLDKNALVNILTKDYLRIAEIENYYKKWINNLIDNNYEISFAAYLFACDAIEKVPVVKQYFETLYNSIYVDEAQDLNYYQLKFIEKLIENTNINCYLIGDKRQSIYQFRGAQPDLFYSMVGKGFKEYKLTYSARCHYNILEFARRIVGESTSKEVISYNKQVSIDDTFIIKPDYFISNDEYFILVETNNEAEEFYKRCLAAGVKNLIYSKAIELKSNKAFADNYQYIIEEILKFYYNHKNKVPKYAYSVEELIIFLDSIIDSKFLNYDSLSIKPAEKAINYIERIFKLSDVQIPKEILNELDAQLFNQTVINHYTKYKVVNRVMTIHSSKGLESNKVFLKFERKEYGINAETKRKLFVGFTRAKNTLVIGFTGYRTSPLEKHIVSIYNSTFI